MSPGGHFELPGAFQSARDLSRWAVEATPRHVVPHIARGHGVWVRAHQPHMNSLHRTWI